MRRDHGKAGEEDKEKGEQAHCLQERSTSDLDYS